MPIIYTRATKWGAWYHKQKQGGDMSGGMEDAAARERAMDQEHRELTGNPDIDGLLWHMIETYQKKNHDYSEPERGDPYKNLRSCEEIGIPAWKGVLVRMSDKWSRLQELSQKKAMVAESFTDTCIDLANYALFCAILRGKWVHDNTDRSGRIPTPEPVDVCVCADCGIELPDGGYHGAVPGGDGLDYRCLCKTCFVKVVNINAGRIGPKEKTNAC